MRRFISSNRAAAVAAPLGLLKSRVRGRVDGPASGEDGGEGMDGLPQVNPPGNRPLEAKSAREAAAVRRANSGSSGYNDDFRFWDVA